LPSPPHDPLQHIVSRTHETPAARHGLHRLPSDALHQSVPQQSSSTPHTASRGTHALHWLTFSSHRVLQHIESRVQCEPFERHGLHRLPSDALHQSVPQHDASDEHAALTGAQHVSSASHAPLQHL
jgi:hypothetical protein